MKKLRLVVISDSHRRQSTVDKILSLEGEAVHIFFLGDVVADIEAFKAIYPEKSFHIVSGNCDFISEYPSSDIVHIGSHRIFYTHGHLYGVKGGIDGLVQNARQLGCDIVLFGHTHISHTSYENGIYAVNPGSCSAPRQGPPSYAVIDIEKNGIMPIIKYI